MRALGTHRLAVCLAAALLCGAAARAQVFDNLGISGRDVGMAGAVTAADPHFSAVFYNPAMLVFQKQTEVDIGVLGALTSAQVKSQDPSRALDCTYCEPPNMAALHVGLLFPLGGKVKNHVAIGVLLDKPSFRLIHISSQNDERPFWYRYQSEDRFALYLGIGIKIAHNFSIGIGGQALADLVGNGATVGVDLFDKKYEVREVDSYLDDTFSPTAGIYWAPTKQLRLGFDYRAPQSVFYQLPASVNLSGIAVLAFTISGYAHYTPHNFTLGAAYQFSDAVTLTGDLTYALWSKAPSPYMNVKIDVSGDVLKALGLEDALALASTPVKPGFADTLSGKIGFEYRSSPNFAFRAGAFYRPTMVPRQDVPETNILDGSAVGLSAGFGVAFKDPLEVFTEPVHIDFGLLATYVFPRTAQKEDTDSVPPYTYSALNVGGGLNVRYDF